MCPLCYPTAETHSIEVHLLELPDLLPAFMQWLDGADIQAVRPLINHNSRLMPNAIRLGGWSHSLGGVMKRVAESFPIWPTYLSKLRALCRFFRNEGYRQHLQTYLKHRGLGLDNTPGCRSGRVSNGGANRKVSVTVRGCVGKFGPPPANRRIDVFHRKTFGDARFPCSLQGFADSARWVSPCDHVFFCSLRRS